MSILKNHEVSGKDPYLNEIWGDRSDRFCDRIADVNNSFLSPKWNIEKFANAPKVLKDAFNVQEDGTFIAKSHQESDVMDGHLKSIPITPGVLLKMLFVYITANDERCFTKSDFLHPVFPGETIRIESDGLYNNNDKQVMNISFKKEQEILTPNTKGVEYNRLTEDMDDYLLQQNKFRFIDSCYKEGPMKDGTLFKGDFSFEKDFQRQSSGAVPNEIIEEFAAQVGSYATGPDINKNQALRNKEENKLNSSGKIFTLKSSLTERNLNNILPGEKATVYGEVIKIDEKSKSAHFCYQVQNSKQEVVLSGEMEGTIIPIGLLDRLHKRQNNN